MRFKDWLLSEFGGAATTAMHGGLVDPSRDNTMLGIRSKYVADGSPPQVSDPKLNPDRLFGKDKRKGKGINTLKKDPLQEPPLSVPAIYT